MMAEHRYDTVPVRVCLRECRDHGSLARGSAPREPAQHRERNQHTAPAHGQDASRTGS
jgi:hypothetical protein